MGSRFDEHKSLTWSFSSDSFWSFLLKWFKGPHGSHGSNRSLLFGGHHETSRLFTQTLLPGSVPIYSEGQPCPTLCSLFPLLAYQVKPHPNMLTEPHSLVTSPQLLPPLLSPPPPPHTHTHTHTAACGNHRSLWHALWGRLLPLHYPLPPNLPLVSPCVRFMTTGEV